MVTLEDQISAVHRLIEDLRWARNAHGRIEHFTYNAMKQIAADLEARLPGKPGEARSLVGSRIADAVRTKTKLGYSLGKLTGIAETVIGCWPVIEYALERAEREQVLS